MIEATAQINIAQPLHLVFEYTIHPNHAKDWYENVKESNCVDNMLQVGSKANLLTNIMGKDFDFSYVIDVLIPNEKLVMKTQSGPFPMESEYTFQSINENETSVTITNRAQPKGVPVFLVSMVKGKVQKTIEESVQNLKKILENQ